MPCGTGPGLRQGSDGLMGLCLGVDGHVGIGGHVGVDIGVGGHVGIGIGERVGIGLGVGTGREGGRFELPLGAEGSGSAAAKVTMEGTRS